MGVTVLCRSWLKRVLRVEAAGGSFEVRYNGRGGWDGEGVYVDGQLAAHNPGLWFGPVFIFPLGEKLAAIEIRCWPWFQIRSFHLLIEDEVVYAEGDRFGFLEPGWADVERDRAAAVQELFEQIRQQLAASQTGDTKEGGGG
jgi:hypothetical protein